MKNYFVKPVLALSLMLVGFVHCGGEETDQISSAVKTGSDWCTTYCSVQNRCDNSIDTEFCKTNCVNTNAITLGHLRTDVLTHEQNCMKAADCATVFGESLIDNCQESSSAMVAPNESTQGFCSAFMKRLSRCETDFTESSCLMVFKIFSDSALKAVGNCLDMECENIVDCLETNL